MFNSMKDPLYGDIKDEWFNIFFDSEYDKFEKVIDLHIKNKAEMSPLFAAIYLTTDDMRLSVCFVGFNMPKNVNQLSDKDAIKLHKFLILETSRKCHTEMTKKLPSALPVFSFLRFPFSKNLRNGLIPGFEIYDSIYCICGVSSNGLKRFSYFKTEKNIPVCKIDGSKYDSKIKNFIYETNQSFFDCIKALKYNYISYNN